MSADIREYLIERFRADGATLRQRATVIAAAPKPPPGPDATLSRGMADACDDVAALAEQLPSHASVEEIITALRGLLPELSARGNSALAQKWPAIKSVYVGASTRVQELITAELNASGGAGVAEDGSAVDDVAEPDEDDEE